MKSTGITRRIDSLGRFVLPVEIRRLLELDADSSIEIFTEGNSVILKKYQPSCIFCGEAKDVVSYRGRNVCTRCIRRLSLLGENAGLPDEE